MNVRLKEYENLSSPTTPSGFLDDDILWVNVKAGNELAFSVLYNRYVNLLFSYGMHICKDRDLVKDCLQDLFARLWTKRETLGVAGSVKGYLFKSFRRLLIGRITSRRKFIFHFRDQSTGFFEFITPIEDSIVEEEGKSQQLKILKAGISTLTKRQREAILLKFFHELSYHEISSVMELHVDSVYNLIFRAIDSLRVKLK